MNTICNFPDIDIYLLYYLDIKTISRLVTISKNQNKLLCNQKFIQEIYALKDKGMNIIGVDEAAEYNFFKYYKMVT